MVGRGPGPLRATRDRTPLNAPPDSWRCESTSSEHRRCLANDATFVGIEHGIRDARKRSIEEVRLHFGVLIGTIQRHECRNDDLRLVFKKFPTLGPEPTLAARAALASRAQGLYEPFHWALPVLAGPFDLDHIPGAARSVGLDAERLVRDTEVPSLDGPIERSAILAAALGVGGSPAFVIGDGMIRGALPLEQFRATIADARIARKAYGIGEAPTEAGSASSRPCRGRRRGPRRVARGYDRAGSTMMRPRPRLSR